MKPHAIVPKLTLAILLSTGALFTSIRSEAGDRPLLLPVDCPSNYEPVICSNGVIYGNSCYAIADGATGCVPYAEF